MINNKLKLTVLHEDDAVFIDHSNNAIDYARDSFNLEVVAAEDFVYIGYYKPISTVYLAMATASTTDTTLSGQYWNGLAWTDLVGYSDDSRAMQRSGFIQWDRNQADEELTTVNGSELFWYRFTLGADTSACVVSGINIVFSDDEDLKKELFEYREFLPTNETSFLLNHVSARDEIIQNIRNNGRYKQNQNNGRNLDLNAFDVLNINQLNKASTYLVMANIMANVLTDPDGLFREKERYYRSKFNSAMDLFYLDLDTDDNGILNRDEELRSFTGTLVRR